MARRLVATDLDGTLFRSDGSVSQRTRTVLAQVEEAGVELVLVTGRPPRLMLGVADKVGQRGVAICSNGAFLYDLREERVVAEHAIPPQTLVEVVRRMRAAIPELGIAVE